MLLKALYDFAHSRKLLDDLAFAPKAIRWVIQLDAEGNLIGVLDTSEDGKQGHKFPQAPKISGAKNSGGIAEFLADRITAVFGLEPEPEKLSTDEKKRQARLKNNEIKYQNFWRQTSKAYSDTQSYVLSAVLKFHEKVGANPSFLRWGVKESSRADDSPAWWVKTVKGEEIKYRADAFTFTVDGNLILEDESVREWWQNYCEQANSQKEANASKGVCLITGQENVLIARTHDRKIEIGFPDTPPGGAAIVSFEKSSPSFSSFGYVQSYNAPTSINAARAYCEALNHLIKNKKHHLRVGNTLICFWARDSEDATDVIVSLFDQPQPDVVYDFLKSPTQGNERSLSQPDEFYSITLTGNSGRIVVRHWLQMPLKLAVVNLRQWFADLQIAPYGNPPSNERFLPLALFRLAMTTVRDKKGLHPDVSAQLYRAALEGMAPPLTLLQPILNRLSMSLARRDPKDTWFSQSRFALLRLIVNRHLRKEGKPEMEPQVFETTDTAYNCGRLLAIFDSLQRSAHGKGFKGATLAERYFGSASVTPNGAFAMLWRLHQHHLKKLRHQGESGQRAAAKIRDSIIQVMTLLRPEQPDGVPSFPRFFTMVQQGQFALGFYHQMAVRKAAIDEYLKKKEAGQLKSEEIDEAIELSENE